MNDERHIAENLAIADSGRPDSLSDRECELVDQAARTYHELMKVNCTGCGYCMPCPEGVMIPAVFEVLNKMHLFGNEQEARFTYAIRMCGIISGTAPGFASVCVQCGECLEKCPQSIQIPDVLAEAVEELEGADLDDRVAFVRQMFKAERT